MMFLMNDVVLNLADGAEVPLTPARFQALSLANIMRLGAELFAAHPRLQHTHPEKARRLAILLQSKDPEVNAALFVAPKENCSPDQVVNRLANLSFDLVARLYLRQEGGELNAVTADREVWRRLAA